MWIKYIFCTYNIAKFSGISRRNMCIFLSHLYSYPLSIILTKAPMWVIISLWENLDQLGKLSLLSRLKLVDGWVFQLVHTLRILILALKVLNRARAVLLTAFWIFNLWKLNLHILFLPLGLSKAKLLKISSVVQNVLRCKVGGW